MHASRLLDRRTFVADLGRGAFAVAVLGVSGCAAPGASETAGPSTPAALGASASPGDASSPAVSPSASAAGGSGSSPGAGTAAWSRVNLGFVSAYVLVREGEAAIVDTGVAGSEGAIEQALGAVGIGWPAVGHVILTHKHADHAGSAQAVLDRASEATGYAGAEDLAAITAPRALTPVQDGDRVFGLQVVTAPGHTAGSICVLDPAGSVLVAGDALRTEGGAPALPGEQFTEDMEQAIASIAKLGGLAFETLLVGHGEPLEGGASAAVATLAAAS